MRHPQAEAGVALRKARQRGPKRLKVLQIAWHADPHRDGTGSAGRVDQRHRGHVHRGGHDLDARASRPRAAAR